MIRQEHANPPPTAMTDAHRHDIPTEMDPPGIPFMSGNFTYLRIISDINSRRLYLVAPISNPKPHTIIGRGLPWIHTMEAARRSSSGAVVIKTHKTSTAGGSLCMSDSLDLGRLDWDQEVAVTRRIQGHANVVLLLTTICGKWSEPLLCGEYGDAGLLCMNEGDVHETSPCMVLEHYPNTLEDFMETDSEGRFLCRKRGESDARCVALSAQWTKHIVHGILQGLAWIHSRGVVHGDIQRRNIFIADDCTASLGDFGATSVCSTNPEGFASVRRHLQCPLYRRPISGSQDRGWRSAVNTSQTDIWALSMLMIELISGCDLVPRNMAEKDATTCAWAIVTRVLQIDLSFPSCNSQPLVHSPARSQSRDMRPQHSPATWKEANSRAHKTRYGGAARSALAQVSSSVPTPKKHIPQPRSHSSGRFHRPRTSKQPGDSLQLLCPENVRLRVALVCRRFEHRLHEWDRANETEPGCPSSQRSGFLSVLRNSFTGANFNSGMTATQLLNLPWFMNS